MEQTEISIVGAGPAGSIAALFLAKEGIRCTLADKARFPRNKICGDGISGWVVDVLSELDKNFLLRFSEQPFLLHSYGIRIVAPNSRQLDLPFLNNRPVNDGIPPGFIAQRIDFDNFLIDEVRSKQEITLKENFEITDYKIKSNGVTLTSGSGESLHSKMVIFAAGANSVFSKNPGGIIKDKKYTMTGIRTYYKGITGFHEKNFVELHFLKDFLPGYFWIFPLPNGLANVGVGLDQYNIAKRKINLKARMVEAIETIPYLKERFKNAEQVSKVEAWSLPLWDGRRKISGERFMLAGDTASLIDPVTGEGMGHAVISGMMAARQAARLLDKGDFSPEFMAQYDQSIYDKIGKELTISSKIPRFIRYAWLFNTMINKALNSKTLQERIGLAMSDLEVRKRLKDPGMYIKVLLGR